MTSVTTQIMGSHLLFACAFMIGISNIVYSGAQKCGGDSSGFNCLTTSSKDEVSNERLNFFQSIPQWIVGTFMTIGPGLFEMGNRSVGHVFDGFAKLSSWTFFPNGTVTFSTKFIQSRSYKKSKEIGDLASYILFAKPKPDFSLYQKLKSFEHGVDNMNVNVIGFKTNTKNSEFAAISDFWPLYEFSGHDLSTVGFLNADLPSSPLGLLDFTSTAHPMPDPDNPGHFFTFVVKQPIITGIYHLVLVRMASIMKREVVAEWKVSNPIPYMHSFSVTKTKVVLVTGPLITNDMCLVQGSPVDCMRWHAKRKSTVYVFDLQKKNQKSFEIDQVFAIHHINAYDLDDKKLVMDLISYNGSEVLNFLRMGVYRNSTLRDKSHGTPSNKRIILNIEEKSAQFYNASTTLSDSCDFPTINENYRYKEYCFMYCWNYYADGHKVESMAVLKKNVCKNGRVEGRIMIPDYYPSEPTFVPNPNGVSEDDGVIMFKYLDGPNVKSLLTIVDAKTFTIIDWAPMSVHMPISFHGRFFRDFY